MLYNKQQCINFVKDYLLPFVNSTDDTRVAAFEKMYIQGQCCYLCHWNEYYGEDETIRVSQSSFNDEKDKPDFVTKVNQLHGLIYKMLTIALVKDGYSRYYPESETSKLSIGEQLDPNDFEKKLQDIVNNNTKHTRFTWRGRGSCYTSDFNAVTNTIIDYMAYTIIDVLLFLFQSICGSDLDEDVSDDGPGYQYFAICPHCNKLFYKKRKDQSYCSEKCRNIAGVIRYAKKN